MNFREHLDFGRAPHPLKDWLVFEVIGGMLGGIISGRVWFPIERGPKITTAIKTVSGGVLMVVGAGLARSGTSDQHFLAVRC